MKRHAVLPQSPSLLAAVLLPVTQPYSPCPKAVDPGYDPGFGCRCFLMVNSKYVPCR